MRLGQSIYTILLAGATIAYAMCPPAPGAVADTIRADLVHPASAVPVASVTVGTPPVEEAQASAAPNLRVTLNRPAGTPLSSILAPPGATPWFTTSTPKQLVWDLAVLEAAKHAIAQGNSIGTVSIARDASDPNSRLIIAMPPGESPPAAPVAMSVPAVQTAIKQALPAWAASATVTTLEDAASERVVTAMIRVPREVLRLYSPETALQSLVSEQQRLAAEGANIGRVIVEVTDTLSGEPIYQAGADSFLGFMAQWYSPLIAGWVGSESVDTAVSPEDTVDQALAGP